MTDYTPLFADGDAEHSFCKDIERLLRDGRAAVAETDVRAALNILATAGIPLAGRCLAVDAEMVTIGGWDDMVRNIEAFDPPITAIGIDMSWPGHIGLEPDAQGRLDPHIETNYYSDAAFSFSKADRATLLQGYCDSGSEWQGCFEDIDSSITIDGLGDLYGAIVSLDIARHADPRDRDMGIAGACFIAVLVHRAVGQAIARRGLPRPMTVLVGSNESYPYFDAPVRTVDSFDGASTAVVRSDPPAALVERIFRRIGW